MKKIILMIVIGFSLFTIQACNNDSDTKTKEDKTMTSNDVPASVQSAFSAKYSTATEVKWEDAHENNVQTYKAKFMVNGKKMKAEFDANGGLVKEEEDN